MPSSEVSGSAHVPHSIQCRTPSHPVVSSFLRYDHLGNELVRAGEDEGIVYAHIDVTALRAHRASAFGRALSESARVPRPGLCELPRGDQWNGVGALGRMNGVL